MADHHVGYYGKLPLWPEFIRSNAVGAEVDDLDRWAREGLHYAKAQVPQGWAEEFAKGDVWNFLLAPEGSPRFVVGVCKLSQDQAGREYPFFLFLRMMRDGLARTTLAPWKCSAFLKEARTVVQDGAVATDLKELRGRLDALGALTIKDSLSAEEAYRRYLQGHRMREFWTGLLGDFAHPLKFHLDHNLMECLVPLRDHASTRLTWGLKFPLMPSTEEEDFDLPFWGSWMARMVRQNLEPVFVLWNRTPTRGKPCMLITISGPSSKTFLFMLRPDLPDDAWYELAADTSRSRPDRRKLLENGDLSLENFLLRLGEGEGGQ